MDYTGITAYKDTQVMRKIKSLPLETQKNAQI